MGKKAWWMVGVLVLLVQGMASSQSVEDLYLDFEQSAAFAELERAYLAEQARLTLVKPVVLDAFDASLGWSVGFVPPVVQGSSVRAELRNGGALELREEPLVPKPQGGYKALGIRATVPYPGEFALQVRAQAPLQMPRGSTHLVLWVHGANWRDQVTVNLVGPQGKKASLEIPELTWSGWKKIVLELSPVLQGSLGSSDSPGSLAESWAIQDFVIRVDPFSWSQDLRYFYFDGLIADGRATP